MFGDQSADPFPQYINTVVIKRVSTFTREVRAALFGASTGGEDDHDQKSMNTQLHEEDSEIHT